MMPELQCLMSTQWSAGKENKRLAVANNNSDKDSKLAHHAGAYLPTQVAAPTVFTPVRA